MVRDLLGGAFCLAVLNAAVLAGASGCQQGESGSQCYCPATGVFPATIELACAAVSGSVQVAGPCTAALANPQSVDVTPTDADGGSCQVEVLLSSGERVSVTIQVTSDWLACGSDPHGCGHATATTPMWSEAGTACGNTGGDAGPSD